MKEKGSINQPLALAALVLLIYMETSHMCSQTRVLLYKVSTEALSMLSEALSSCLPRRSKRCTLLYHRPSALSQDLPLWAMLHGSG